VNDALSPAQRPFISSSPEVFWYGQDGTNNYDTGSANSGYIIFGPYTAQTGYGFYFWSWEQTEDFLFPGSVDTRKIYISADSGATWTFSREIYGIENEWHRVLTDISAYAGQSILIKAEFNTIDKFNNNFRGWYIDDAGILPAKQQDILSDSLDCTSLVFTTGGDADWFSQTIDSKYGGSAARSGKVGDNQVSFIKTTINGPGYVSFYWKVSSEYNFDYLDLFIDGELTMPEPSYERLSGTDDQTYWTKSSVFIPSGTHEVQWQYTKDESDSDGQDCGWLDRVVFSPGGPEQPMPTFDMSTPTSAGTPTKTPTRTTVPTRTPTFTATPTFTPAAVTLNTALDNMTLSFTRPGLDAWSGELPVSFYGGSAAQCSGVQDSQSSSIMTSVNGSCTLSFSWKVSCEEDYDFLTFYIDGVEQESITGEYDWESVSYDIPAGAHTVAWEYSKDIDTSAGLDSAWIDKVEIISATPAATRTISPASTSTPTFTVSYVFSSTVTPTSTLTMIVPAATPSPSLQEALDNFSVVFTAAGPAPWVGQGEKFFFGGSSAQAGPMGDNMSTTLDAYVSGAGTMSFYWKSDTEWGDYLYFYVDGAVISSINSQQPWQRIDAVISSAGSHHLQWVYSKDSYTNYNDYGYVHDRVWLDKAGFIPGTYTVTPTNTGSPTATATATRTVQCTETSSPVFTATATGSPYPEPTATRTAMPTVGINEAVDNYSMVFTCGGSAPWYGEINNGAYTNGSNARSGAIGDNQYSYLETRVYGPGTLSFYASFSAESSERFDLDIQSQYGSYGGGYGIGSDWDHITVNLYQGINVIRWIYTKDSSTSEGDDCLRIDGITFTADNSTQTPWPTNTRVYTPTVTLTVSPVHTPVIIPVAESHWYEATDNSGMGLRYGHKCLVHNNKIWLTGGYNGSNKGDVWSSSDGTAWTRTNPDAFPARLFHAAVSFKDRMWVIGGMGGSSSDTFNDVWSSADGTSWKLENAHAPFHDRYGLSCLVFNGRMWVIGGGYYDETEDNSVFFNDVWSSDDGINWIKEKDHAAFNARADALAAVFNNKMWIIGGTYDGSSMDAIYKDIWSSADGKNWTLVTADPAFGDRYSASAVVHDNKLWIIAGTGSSYGGLYRNDIWYSIDGYNWQEATNSAEFEARAGHDSVEFDNRLWVIGGIFNDYGSDWKADVWYAPFKGTPTVTPTFSASPTISPTASISATFTISPTSSMTYTISPTHTVSPTFTASEFVTPTPTFTVTATATATVTATNGVMPGTGMIWQLAADPAAFQGRYGAASAVFQGKMWLIGGIGQTDAYNDIYSSTDGITWNLETASANFSPRGMDTCVVMNGRMWIIGGSDTSGNVFGDVWSSGDGVNWTQETPDTGFTRFWHASFVYGGKMWVIGGLDNTNLYGDVWSSPDGVNWTQETSTPGFSPRLGMSGAVFNGKMWVMNGMDFTDFHNDIYSSTDGITWNQETPGAAYPPSFSNTLLEFGGKLWMIGGEDETDFMNQVWSSDNGVDWNAETLDAEFLPRAASSGYVYNNRIWAAGGYNGVSMLADVWFSPPGIIPTATGTAGADTATVTATSTLTQTGTATFTPTATMTPTRSFTPSFTITGMQTSTATPSATATITGTPPSPTDTPTGTATITGTPPTASPTASVSTTGSITFSPSPTATLTYTATSTSTAAYTRTFTATMTATNTAGSTSTRTQTATMTRTISPTMTATATPSFSSTQTITFSVTRTFTMTVTRTRTQTPTNTDTPAGTATVTPSFTPTVAATRDVFEITDVKTYPNPYSALSGNGFNISYNLTQGVNSAMMCIYSNSFRLIRRVGLSRQDTQGIKVKNIPAAVFKDTGSGTYFYCIEGVNVSGKKVRSKAGIIILLN
jgi:hypothetical protein